MKNKKTLVIGASTKLDRYSNQAVRSLLNHGHEVVAIGTSIGEIEDIKINNIKIAVENVHTVTMYVSPKNQPEYYDYITNIISPERVVFNPGTENQEFMKKLGESGIEVEIACTLVLLSIGAY